MSKYIDAVKTARPEHLYVFDLDRADLDTGTVSDNGYNPLGLTIVEAVGASVDVKEPLIEGVGRCNHPNVIHDFGSNTGSYATFEMDATVGPRYFGPDAINEWSIEMVIRPGKYRRARFSADGILIAFNQTAIEGFMLNFDFTNQESPTVQFEYQVDLVGAPDTVVLQSSVYDVDDDVFHLVLSKGGDRYSLAVNGKIDGTGQVDLDYQSLNSNIVKIGGWDSRDHADVDLQSVAFFDRLMAPEELDSRYSLLTFLTNYELTAEFFVPDVEVMPEGQGQGSLAPFIDKLSEGASSEDFYEDENGYLSIQPSELTAGVNKYKKEKYDLSGLTAGVSTYQVTTVVSGSSSRVNIQYSFDDLSYQTFQEGLDTIPELNANWGGVV